MTEQPKEEFALWELVAGVSTLIVAICAFLLGGSWLLGLFWRAFKWGAGME